jgi:hypothetical protein
MSVSNRKRSDLSDTGPNGASVKLRWLELDIEGGTPDLVERLKSVTAALPRSGPVTIPARTLPAPKPATNAPIEGVEAPVWQGETAVDAPEMGVAEHLPSGTTARGEVDRPRRRSSPKTPKFLSDLDLTKAQVALGEFVGEKKPGGQMEKYVVIAVWLKDHFGIEEISVDHIFTAYTCLGWQAELPSDPSQTFRNIKSSKNWFDRGSDRGCYKVNWNGVSAVMRMGAAQS